MKILDLYCKAGGAAAGYERAGHTVTGVDIEPQPHYPFEFIQADALEFPLEGYDFIHASPPCQWWCRYRNVRKDIRSRYLNLIEPTRLRLQAAGVPYVIENVPGAPLLNPVQLCGTSFGIPVRRHRNFEVRGLVIPPVPCRHQDFTERRFPGSSNRPNGRTVCNIGEYRVPLAVQKQCMQVDWSVTLHELSEMVPPVYTQYIGTVLTDRE